MTQIDTSLHLFEGHIGVFDPKNLRRVDWVLVGLTAVLAIAGLMTLYSASFGEYIRADASNDLGFLGSLQTVAASWFGRQLAYLLVGVALAALIISLDYRLLVSLGPTMYIIVLILLVLVHFFGEEVNGARRWLDLGFTKLQPSEFSKPALVYMLAWYLSRIGERVQNVFLFALALIFMAIPAGLIFLQPSLSVAIVLAPIVLIMLFTAGCRLWQILVLVLPGILLAGLVWWQVTDYERLNQDVDAYMAKSYPLGIRLSPHQIDRILTFRDPERDPRDKGYQAIQMKITVGSGEVLGKGYGKGTQTHFKFLPEFHTDLIFALLAEEWGFVGAAAVAIVFLAFLMRALALAASCTEPSGSLLAVGCAAVLGFHAFANMAITVGLLPVTGMPLPFLSYGGSFYMTTMICVGTILSVHVRKRFLQ